MEYASEFRYRDAPIDKNVLVVAISQSGETIDTCAPARQSALRTLAINNSVGSLPAKAMVAFASTLAPRLGFDQSITSQITISALLALYLGRLRDLSYAPDGVDSESSQGRAEQVKSSSRTIKLHPSQKNMLNTRILFLVVS